MVFFIRFTFSFFEGAASFLIYYLGNNGILIACRIKKSVLKEISKKDLLAREHSVENVVRLAKLDY